jgi:hypothetical protein
MAVVPVITSLMVTVFVKLNATAVVRAIAT